MNITLRDVARRACVSASTVSRVLNDYPYVDDRTRSTVWRAARELGYSTDRLRRPREMPPSILLLVRDQSQSVALEGGLATIERSIAAGARRVFAGCATNVRVEQTSMRPKEARRYAEDAGVAGLIFIGGMIESEFAARLLRLGMPFVVAGAHLQPLPVDCITADYCGGTERATDHLIRRGRRRLALVNGVPSTTSSAEKYRGFRLSLALNGVDFAPERVVVSDFSSEAGYAATLQLLDGSPDVDGIVYADDNVAIGGLHALKERGRRVPEDVAITGYYDYGNARFMDPPLTTVHCDLPAMGEMAAQRLRALLDGSAPAPTFDPADDGAPPRAHPWLVTLPTSLVVRQSS